MVKPLWKSEWIILKKIKVDLVYHLLSYFVIVVIKTWWKATRKKCLSHLKANSPSWRKIRAKIQVRNWKKGTWENDFTWLAVHGFLSLLFLILLIFFHATYFGHVFSLPSPPWSFSSPDPPSLSLYISLLCYITQHICLGGTYSTAVWGLTY